MKSPVGNPSVEIVSDMTVFDLVTKIVNTAEQEEPFFVADASDIVFKYKMWKLKMPRVEPFYAVKCNDSPIILHLLAALGVNFDCASKAEIESVLSMGVDPSRIIYANPCKTKGFIRHAAKAGVDMMTFDNAVELRKVKENHPKAKLVIRIRVDDSASVCQLGVKFGCRIGDVPYLLQAAKDLDLDVIGVSFHVGSGCQDNVAYRTAIMAAYHAFEIGKNIGHNMDFLDIGGGFPGVKGPYISFEEIVGTVNECLDEFFPPESGVRIIAEPGRYFVASAFTLCANVIAKRETVTEEGDPINMYYLNDGVYGSFNCLIFDHAEVEPIPLVDLHDRQLMKSSVWGPTCDSMDCILKSCTLPSMEVGEWIMFENMGAYTICAASNFNGFQKPEMIWALPIHVLTYLQQLPTWPDLVEAFGGKALDLPNINITPECENIANKGVMKALQRRESVSA